MPTRSPMQQLTRVRLESPSQLWARDAACFSLAVGRIRMRRRMVTSMRKRSLRAHGRSRPSSNPRFASTRHNGSGRIVVGGRSPSHRNSGEDAQRALAEWAGIRDRFFGIAMPAFWRLQPSAQRRGFGIWSAKVATLAAWRLQLPALACRHSCA